MAKRVGIAALLMIVITVVGYLWTIRDQMAPGDDEGSVASERLELARTGLSATENQETELADQAWSALQSQQPEDRSIATNLAINRVLRVDALTDTTANVMSDEAAKQAARMQLPDAIAMARTAIEQLANVGADADLQLWLSSRVALNEASLLPASIGKSIRKDLFDQLASRIMNEEANTNRSAMLGGSLHRVLEELESPRDGLPADVIAKAATAFAALSKQQADNLFIALRSARLNIDAKSQAAVPAIQQTLTLAEAIKPSLSAQTQSIGLTPEQLVDKITMAVQAEDWPMANNQMLLWFNVLNGTDLVKTDRRRASPHPLDLLDFAVMRRLAAEVVRNRPLQAGQQPIQFESQTLDGLENVDVITRIDADLDLDPDLLAVHDSRTLKLIENRQSEGWQTRGTLTLETPVTGAVVADLFMVDASDPARLQFHAAAATDPAVASDNGQNPALQAVSSRHTTLQSVLLYGAAGVQLIVADGRAQTAADDCLKTVTGHGLESLQNVTCAVAGDLEGDGDLDLAIAERETGIRIFVNRGNRTFFEAPAPVGDGGEDVISMAIVDLDRDLDLDVVTLERETGRVGLLENLLHLQFRHRELTGITAVPGATHVEIAEVDGNVSWDLIVSGSEQTRVIYSQTADAGVWTVETSKELANSTGPMTTADFDNDSFLELLPASPAGQAVRLAAGETQPLSTNALAFNRTSPVIADFDRDGLLDVACVVDGRVQWHRNVTPSPGHYVDVRFKGIDDNNANSGRVNHYAVGSVLELRFGPHYRAKVITEPSTHFGIDGVDDPGMLRVIFPNGLTQTVSNPGLDTLVEEEQTLKGSCPYVYAWNGKRMEFVTDCLWAAPLGLQVAAGVVAKDRPWEFLKIDGRFLAPRDGQYELRITEELWEVAYFDQIELLAVDHPEDTEIWTNEKVGPAEIATPRIYAFDRDEKRVPSQALDTTGRDVTESLAVQDQTYVQGFDRRLRQGLCPPHWIDLRFPASDAIQTDAKRLYLVLTGWILPTDTSLNIQIDQNPELPAIEFPSLWVPDAKENGGWRKAIPFMGFPGGKTKTIVVDVTDIAVPNDMRFRVRTSAQIYWDHAELVVQKEVATFQEKSLHLSSAVLGYHGFSQRQKLDSTKPESYRYEVAEQRPKWPPLQGRFSVYGPCADLISQWDDRMAVLGSGDELVLHFDQPDTPPPAGWKRDFVLHCVGWDKDADLNTLTGQSSHPLPFKSMTSYPALSAEQRAQEAVEQKNAGHLQREMSFREFWHR